MRLLFPCSLLACLAGLSFAQTQPVTPRSALPVAAGPANRTKPISYERDIEPILLKHCHKCHSAAAETKGGLDMTTYDTFMKGGQSGSPVEPGKSARSLLLLLVFRDQKPFMPPATEEPPPIEALLRIKEWIDQGAKGPGGKTPPK